MTLSQTVLFPQAMMPLFIFEPRYREMLSTVLEGDRIFAVAALDELISESDGNEETLGSIQPTLLALVQIQMRLGAEIPQEVLQFLSNLKEPESVLDLAIYTLCPSGSFKQDLLETRGILSRFGKFERFLRSQVDRLKLDRKLKGGLDEDGVGNN